MAGLGSRFFEVLNPGAPAVSATVEARATAAPADLPGSFPAPVHLVRGLTGRREAVRTDRRGTRHVALRALDLAYLDLGGRPAPRTTGPRPRRPARPAAGRLDPRSGDRRVCLAIGPGFVGVYDLRFVRTADGQREALPVRLVVQPHHTASATPLFSARRRPGPSPCRLRWPGGP